MAAVIFLCSLFTACLGVAIGYLIGYWQFLGKKKKNANTIKRDNNEAIEINNISDGKELKYANIELLPASANKEIAQIADADGTSEKMQLVKKIAQVINEAAQKGYTKVEIDKDYHELNNEIKSKLTKRDIYNYFCEAGYWVEFTYCMLANSSIEYISWEREEGGMSE